MFKFAKDEKKRLYIASILKNDEEKQEAILSIVRNAEKKLSTLTKNI